MQETNEIMDPFDSDRTRAVRNRAHTHTVRTLPMLRIRPVSLGALLDIDWDNTALAGP